MKIHNIQPLILVLVIITVCSGQLNAQKNQKTNLDVPVTNSESEVNPAIGRELCKIAVDPYVKKEHDDHPLTAFEEIVFKYVIGEDDFLVNWNPKKWRELVPKFSEVWENQLAGLTCEDNGGNGKERLFIRILTDSGNKKLMRILTSQRVYNININKLLGTPPNEFTAYEWLNAIIEYPTAGYTNTSTFKEYRSEFFDPNNADPRRRGLTAAQVKARQNQTQK